MGGLIPSNPLTYSKVIKLHSQREFRLPLFWLVKKNNTLGPTCYYCTECGLGFAQPNALKSHLFLAACGTGGREVDTNTRTETLRHTCTFCGRRYARRYSLVIHQRTHTGHKPLICRVCARRFGDPSNLNKHLRTHGVGIGGSSNSGVRNPYVCRTCGNVSARRRDFERHMKRKHEAERT
ncbi:PR domain zinc finger protein [Echinococcus granulosus]|uniref:PR domain zinc finger protein n=1 Tax=Echinococcus granulosus TaxID=6210 RepID=W6UBW4_ECHGR|nr:PR domain zinc finger protein [Echinococcus granulosus]EUB55927.1 PR domain zinc finger protein [Echinococcus granulosus]